MPRFYPFPILSSAEILPLSIPSHVIFSSSHSCQFLDWFGYLNPLFFRPSVTPVALRSAVLTYSIASGPDQETSLISDIITCQCNEVTLHNNLQILIWLAVDIHVFLATVFSVKVFDKSVRLKITWPRWDAPFQAENNVSQIISMKTGQQNWPLHFPVAKKPYKTKTIQIQIFDSSFVFFINRNIIRFISWFLNYLTVLFGKWLTIMDDPL